MLVRVHARLASLGLKLRLWQRGKSKGVFVVFEAPPAQGRLQQGGAAASHWALGCTKTQPLACGAAPGLGNHGLWTRNCSDCSKKTSMQQLELLGSVSLYTPAGNCYPQSLLPVTSHASHQFPIPALPLLLYSHGFFVALSVARSFS